MIDYEKLKLAHELAEKYAEQNKETSSIVHHYYGSSRQSYFEWQTFSHDYLKFSDIDDLINRLQEITQPEPKYNDGDQVYWIYDAVIYSGITDTFFANKRYQINMDHGCINLDESQLYPSREALIDAQIEYWLSQRSEDSVESACEYLVARARARYEKLTTPMSPTFEGEIKGFSSLADKEWKHELAICDHECSAEMILINPGQYKCIKCGEFYR